MSELEFKPGKTIGRGIRVPKEHNVSNPEKFSLIQESIAEMRKEAAKAGLGLTDPIYKVGDVNTDCPAHYREVSYEMTVLGRTA